MPASTHMEIAEVRFAFHSQGAALLPDPWPCYRTFSDSPAAGPADVQVSLGLEIGGQPDLTGLERIFEAGSWSLYRKADGYCFALAPRGPGLAPAWVACVDRTFTRGTVFCDEALLREQGGIRGIVNPVLQRLDQLLLMNILAMRDGGLFHAAGASVGGQGLLFAGRSGAGKSTIARLFASNPLVGRAVPARRPGFAEGSAEASGAAGRSALPRDSREPGRDLVLLSDDRMIVRRMGGVFTAFGTPWAGDAQIALNASAPLSALLFLHHGESDRAEPLSPRDALEQMLPVMSVPWYDRGMVERITSFCAGLLDSVPAYDLHFRPTPAVVGLVDRLVSGKARARG